MRQKSIASGQRQPIHLHMLTIGGKGQGKTTWAATWPNPYFLCCSAEHGRETIEGLFDNVAVDTWEDFEEELTEIEGLVRQGRWICPTNGMPYRTLVMDAASTLGLLCEQWATRKMRKVCNNDENAVDSRNQQKWGWAKDAFIAAMTRAHALPIHVLWLGHADDKTYTDKKGQEHIAKRLLDYPGKGGREQLMRDVFAYTGITRRVVNGVKSQVLRLAPDGLSDFSVRRDGFLDRSAYPLPEQIENPSFAAFAYYLGLAGVAVYDAPPPPQLVGP